MKRIAALFAILAGSFGITVHGSLLVYEGFDPVGAVNGSTIASLSGATSIGFASESSWGAVGAGTFSATYQATGLSFGSNFQATGGALKMSIGNNSSNAVNAFRQSGVSVAGGSTLWGSFLFQHDSSKSRQVTFVGVESGASTNFAGTAITQHRLGDNDDPFFMTFQPDSFNNTDASYVSSQAVKVRRFGTGSFASTGAINDPVVSSNATYLSVWKLTNAWDGIAPTSNQVATMWTLTLSQYDFILANGGMTEANLNTSSFSKVELTNGLQGRLLSSDFINLAALQGGATTAYNTTVDEIRMGTTLAAVTPIPEPATYAALIGALALAGAMVRRRLRAR
jgi:hypothetical protein